MIPYHNSFTLDLHVILQESQIEQLKSRKQEILEKCELEHIQLPTVDDPMETDSATLTPTFDYSQLSRSHSHAVRTSDREKVEAEFKNKMESFVAEIEKTAPNLKALDQYEALQEREREVVEEFEAVRREEKEIAERYNGVKQRRYAYIFSLCTLGKTSYITTLTEQSKDIMHNTFDVVVSLGATV